MTDAQGQVRIRVIDPAAIQEIQVKNLKIRARIPNLAQRLAFVAAIGQDGKFRDIDFDKLIKAAADCIVSIDAWEKYEPEDVLQGLQDPDDLLQIVRTIRDLAELSEDQGKK